MDPFSITVGALALVEASVKLVRFLKSIPDAIAEAKHDLHTLIAELDSLKAVTHSVQETYNREVERVATAPSESKSLNDRWEFCGRSLRACKGIADQLNTLYEDIYKETGFKVTGKRNAIWKTHRRHDKDGKLQRLRADLATEKDNLQILLMTITVTSQEASHDKLDRIFDRLKEFERDSKSQSETWKSRIQLDVKDLDMTHRYVDALHRLRKLQEFVTTAFRTRHFYTPQPVSTFYTGRAQYLKKLQEVFFKDDLVHRQARFVVHGMGGSGKTQFCCKFADENRERFWAVFWIDGRSIELIKQSYAEIGKYGAVERNHVAAMHWLTTLDKPWLLIIDNVDDKALDLDEYFPKINRGHILITTRVRAHKVYGNVGAGSFGFEGMNEEEASTLLLRSAGLPETPDVDTKSWVTMIIKKLGSLALAVLHAGAAIRKSICTLKNYLTFFDDDLKRLRLQRRSSNMGIASLEEGHMKAHVTFEIMYNGIEKQNPESSRDAIQLLKMFSFFHCENIRRDVLEKAIYNRKIEKEQDQYQDPEEGKRPSTWAKKGNELFFAFLAFIMQDRPPTLPQLIQEGLASGVMGTRLGYALGELINMSIITPHETDGVVRYSIHSLVHQWVRERPGMSLSEQDIWSKAAATTLAHSIILPLPPHTNTAESAPFRRELVQHIGHVLARRKEIEERINRGWWISKWLGTISKFGSDQARQYSKFSLVFTETGHWEQARILQETVKEWTDSVLGLEHAGARRITMALSGTYWYLSRGDEAANLQEAVLKACESCLGPNSRETLVTMDTLGRSRWWQGRYTEARKLHEVAVRGLAALKSDDNEALLIAKANLGRALAKFYENLEEAQELFEEAFYGMMKNPKLGRTHEHTLGVKEDLAMLQLQMNGDKHVVLKSIQEVLDDRTATLGKEHPFTLIAMASLARVNIELQEFTKAEELVCSGLEIADRNLGEEHIGTLMGRTVLGAIYTHQRKFKAAEKTLKAAMKGQATISSQIGENNPDRLATMMQLATCYEKQEKFDDSIKLCDQIIEGLSKISYTEHPLQRKTQQQRNKLIKDRDAKKDSQHGDRVAT
ncbi:tetratricopeptide repeat domain-containing protein [Penicillium canescens]|nr:tetratricopeptide repeat domain-containing protein [Penicillium canescens]